MKSTGIALFAYNRPNRLQRVLNHLQHNEVNHLYCFVDGPKTKYDQQKVNRTKNILQDVHWCNIKIISRERNLGLAESITSGVEYVLNKHDRIIVLEDDCVPAPNFVSFMEKCLKKYKDENRVMNVNGYSLPITLPSNYPYDVYFTFRSSSWGWGTWKSSWSHFEQDPMNIEEFKQKADYIREITEKAGPDIYSMIRKQLEGQIDSWAVWWSYAIAKNNGICVNPTNSKIKNIGFDEGTHADNSDPHGVELDDTPVDEMQFPDTAVVDTRINKKYNKFIQDQNRPKLKNLILNWFSNSCQG